MVVEIIILIIGILCIVLGFVIPDQSRGISDRDLKKETDKIGEIVNKELENRKSSFDESLDESVKDSLDKAERLLEKLSNEKIMAVSEFGDTILSDINKSHEEALFLYNMLNDKHDELLKSQNEIESASKEVRTIIDSFENVKNEANADLLRNKEEIIDSLNKKENEIEIEQNLLSAMKDEFDKNTDDKNLSLKETKKPSRKQVKRTPDTASVTNLAENHNEDIIRLYKEGKSNVAIAKELGLGVGEVKLVIDLANM